MAGTQAQDRSALGRLVLRRPAGSTEEPVALRLRAEHLLSTATWQPPGMPPGALLVVRSLRGLPPLSPGQSAAAWHEALHARLDQLYREAAYPALGPVPPHAPSVCFDDPAELLACLTRDVLGGYVWTRWYWQQVCHPYPRAPAPLLAEAWSERAAALPAALALLEPITVLAALRRLAPHETSQVVRALHACFELPPTVLHVTLPDAPPPPPGTPAVTGDAAWPRSPWQRWLPDAPPDLAPQTTYLWGLSQTLHHAPAFARSAPFAARSAIWLRAALARPQSPAGAPNDPAPHPTISPAPGDARAPHDRDLPRPRAPEVEAVKPDAPRAASPVPPPAPGTPLTAEPGAPLTVEPGTPRPHAPSSSGERPHEGADPEAGPRADVDRPPLRAAAPASPPAPPPAPGEALTVERGDPRPLPREGVPTELGGLLYLIHLLRWLNLPNGWDEAGQLAEHLSGWTIVEALGRGLLGAAHDAHEADAIWPLLATLDGRAPGEPAGGTLPPLDLFRLPPTWLRRLAPDAPAWRASVANASLRLADADAGYLVAEVPLLGDAPDERLARELAEYRAAGITASATWGESPPLPRLAPGAKAALSHALAAWLVRVLGAVQHTLARALRVPPPDVADVLLPGPGRLRLSRTHLDLHLPLEAIRLPVRRAGLDCDPGWMPDLGYIVLFHFD